MENTSIKSLLFVLLLLYLSIDPSLFAADSRENSGNILPNTQVGRRFGKWVEAFNSGDPDVMRRFIDEYCDPETVKWSNPLNLFLSTFPDFRRITIERIEYSSEYRLVTLGREGLTGQWIKMYARVECSRHIGSH
jgi:hypothetical protein